MWETLVAGMQKSAVAIAALVAFGGMMLLVSFVRNRVQQMLSKKFVLTEIRCSQKITEILVEIRVKCRADRVAIYLFHNGERYTNGNSILRLSAAYETVGNGISPQRDQAQNILISSVSESVAFLADEEARDKVFYREVADIPTCSYKAVLEAQGVKSVAKYPLHDGEDVIGFICLDFVVNKPEVGELVCVSNAAGRLELYLKNNKKPSLLYKVLK